ncbi:putative peptidase S10 family protein [Lyophyllum shimeji]|uniref:Carboxypeptidase n=1 Tax=Lyophyllum shimeji TaxID=47721 RepID=A0A9P3PPY7_LYOSH|nr:putative peptidase S10 family protein [Lyophyllum shimeji]
MLLHCLALSLAIVEALAGQVPVIDGVVGGVSSSHVDLALSESKVLSNAATNATTTPGKLRVSENSGICETTPGVYQASGYADIAANQSIWFWFFASRKDPDTAPLALWFNGGPGSSSMIGLFQEHGPCRITNDSSSVTINPYSWNNEANVLYIDQPVGVGFSHGELKVGTSQQAAADVWTFMQIFLSDSRFSKYQQNSLAIWTESYGGHYGPAFAAHFLAQNSAIAAGTVQGLNLNLKVLGIGNGLTDPLIQYAQYAVYAETNPYHPLVSQAVISNANTSWSQPNGCRDQITACNNGGSDTVCSSAQSFCNRFVLSPLAGNFDVYYVPATNPDPYPPPLDNYLRSIASKIGAESEWQESNLAVYQNFAATGDWMRSSKRDLETVIDAGVRVLVFDGDADFILNFNGVEAMVDALSTKFTSTYQQQKFQTYKVNDQIAGQFRNAGTFSYIRVYGAGHEVPAYKFGSLDYGQAAAQIFTQIMANPSLSSSAPPRDTSSARPKKSYTLLATIPIALVSYIAIAYLPI